MRGYRTVADEKILKVLYSDRIILEEKKKTRGHYYLMGSLVRGGALGARRSPERGGALGGGESGTRHETRENKRRYRRVRFLLPQDDIPSRSLVRVDTVYDGGGVERSGLTPTFAHP